MTEMLDQFILQITTLKGPSAVVVFLVMFGYALKMTPMVVNRYIPLINFILGPILTIFIVDFPTPGSMPPGVRYPEIAAWLTSILTGFLLACLAWISHAQILRKWIDDKVPALNPDKTMDKKTVSEESTNADGTAKIEQTMTTTTTDKKE